MMASKRTRDPHIGKGMVEPVLDDTISEEEMDRLLAEDVNEINAFLQKAREQARRAPRLAEMADSSRGVLGVTVTSDQLPK